MTCGPENLAAGKERYPGGGFSEHDLEVAAFTIFLYGRMIGCAAEIDDHLA